MALRELTEKEASLWNDNMVADLEAPGGEGITKQASVLNEHLVMGELYEDGIVRRIYDYEKIEPADLDKDFENPNIPTKIVPVEDRLNRYLVRSTDWLQPSRDLWYNGKFAKIRFRPLQSERIKLDKGQILASPFPIRQYLEGLIKNDFLAEEDAEFFERVERCLYARAAVGDNATIQSTNANFLLEDIAELAKVFARSKVPLHCIAINEATFYDILKWTQGDVGSFVMKDLVETGAVNAAVKFKSYAGFKWALTNNPDVIPEKTLYGLTTQQMLGKFYQLQAPQAYIKYEYGVLEISADEVLGREIINTRGVAKLKLA